VLQKKSSTPFFDSASRPPKFQKKKILQHINVAAHCAALSPNIVDRSMLQHIRTSCVVLQSLSETPADDSEKPSNTASSFPDILHPPANKFENPEKKSKSTKSRKKKKKNSQTFEAISTRTQDQPDFRMHQQPGDFRIQHQPLHDDASATWSGRDSNDHGSVSQ
jgi:hypothetical protein